MQDSRQSGASLERSGVDLMRDLAAAGVTTLMLAQDHDSLALRPPITTCSTGSLRNTVAKCVLRTTGEMTLQKES
jgi:hypothetical protein